MAKDLKEARLNIAQSVLEQMVANPVQWAEAYLDRPNEMIDMEPEQYMAKVAVRYADALINELYYDNPE